MRLKRETECDVLVIGSGIAGITAALEAAKAGRKVTLLCRGALFSGSSFYPGTWGLGLIGPADDDDRQDLEETIQLVGCGMADPVMVHAFVNGIRPAIDNLKKMGVHLRHADHAGEKEFIPCFDHKARDWNGLEFDSARQVFSSDLEKYGVNILAKCQVLELVKDGQRVCGAVVRQKEELHYLGCRTVVLATGGFGRLMRYHLCTEDVAGEGQALALQAGAVLMNMEFFQMMPGYVSPAPRTVFNEKTFRFAEMTAGGEPLLPPGPDTEKLLELRSSHGPFTSRLPSRAVDLALYRAFLKDPSGVTVHYKSSMKENPPEFIQTYFDWLKKAKGLTADTPIHIGVFAHAANGGIRITPDASTGVAGLYACGEVTGGMHGADRIGGLSTANGLVFGGIAGRSAATACDYLQNCGPEEVDFISWTMKDIRAAESKMQDIMFRNAMIIRNESGLYKALETVKKLREEMAESETESAAEASEGCRLHAQLITAESILLSASMRKESRGSHYRSDYPYQDDTQSRRIEIKYDASGLKARLSED